MPGLLPLREFLLNTTSILAEVNKLVQFTTVTGFPVSNRYHSMRTRRVMKPNAKRVKIADGYYPDLLAEDAKSGVVANCIQAEDASFAALVVNACPFQVAIVHDSFSMLANRVDQFRGIARERFEWMYNNHDLLEDIRNRAEAALSEPAIVDGLQREADKANARRGGAPHKRLVNMVKKAERALNNPIAQTLPSVPPRGNLDLRSISLDFIS
jgi:DNA-directed RNA polymerase